MNEHEALNRLHLHVFKIEMKKERFLIKKKCFYVFDQTELCMMEKKDF